MNLLCEETMRRLVYSTINGSLIATALFGLSLLLVGLVRGDQALEPPERLDQLPARHVDGSAARLASSGTPTLYLVLSPECEVSRAVMPYWRVISAAAVEAGYRVVALGWDDESPDAVERFVRESGLEVDLVLVPYQAVERLVGVATTPTVIVVDEAGETVSVGLGRVESTAVLESLFGIPDPAASAVSNDER